MKLIRHIIFLISIFCCFGLSAQNKPDPRVLVKQAGASNGQVLKWDGTKWTPQAESGNRPDSAFAVGAYNSPSYWAKTINSSLFKKGTLSVRTADTTGMLTLNQAEAGSQKPSLYFMGDGEVIWKIKKDSRSGTGTDFNFVRKFGPSGSDGLNNNQIFSAGWNVTSGGGMENPLYPSCSYRIEENFQNGAANLNAFECHLPHIEFTNNTSRRPLTGYFSRSHVNPKGNWSFDTDFLNFNDYKAGVQKAIWALSENTGYSKGITFLDTAFFTMQRNNVGGFWQSNAAGNSAIRMLMVDNTNRILLGGAGPATNVAITDELQITNNGYLWNEGGVINMGKNTTTEGVTLDLKSETNTTLQLSSPLANAYLRIGTTNEGSGNYMSTMFSATGERFFQARQDVSDRLFTMSGTKVAINAYAPDFTRTFTVGGTAQIGTGSDANASSMLNIKSNAYDVDLFVNNQSPESISTANQGSIALVNDGGNGALYGKFSGTGNTGWGKFLNLKDANGASSNQVLQWNGTSWVPSSVGGIGGSGTTNFVTKFTGPNSIGNSTIVDDGTDVFFNWASKVSIYFNSSYNMGMKKGTGRDLELYANSPDNDAKVSLVAAGNTALTADHLGNVGIGTTSPTRKLDVNGDTRLRGLIYDVNNEAGTNGQILSKTATGVDWIDAPTGGGVTTVGAFQATSTANGLSISGTDVRLHAADITNPGAVTTTTQAFSGRKEFQVTAPSSSDAVKFTNTSTSGSAQVKATFRVGTFDAANIEVDNLVSDTRGVLNINVVDPNNEPTPYLSANGEAQKVIHHKGYRVAVRSVGGSTTIADADYYVRLSTSTANTYTFTLPAGGIGDQFVVVNDGGAGVNLNVVGNGSDTVENTTSIAVGNGGVTKTFTKVSSSNWDVQ